MQENVRKKFAELLARVEIKTYIFMVFWAKFCWLLPVKSFVTKQQISSYKPTKIF